MSGLSICERQIRFVLCVKRLILKRINQQAKETLACSGVVTELGCVDSFNRNDKKNVIEVGLRTIEWQWCTPLILALRSQRQVDDICEFEASLVYKS